MIGPTLIEIMEFADAQMLRIFKMTQRIYPMWHMVTASGATKIAPSPHHDKDTCVTLIRALFESLDVVRYVYIDECWTIEISAEDKAKVEEHLQREGNLEKYPGRIERVQFQGEDRDQGLLIWSREIIRPRIGPPRLGPLDKDDYDRSEGRFVGLLPKSKSTRH